MKYKPIEINLFNMLMESLWLTLMLANIPANIFLLVVSDSIAKTIFHSLLLMYFTSVLTVKAFAQRVRKDVREVKKNENNR